MLRIAASQLPTDLGISLRPERHEILGHLDGSVGGRQEVEGQRHLTAEHRRRLDESKEFLEPNGKHRTVLGRVIDRDATARGNLPVGRRDPIEFSPLAPVEQAGEHIASRHRLEVLATTGAVESGRQPRVGRGEQVVVPNGRPGLRVVGVDECQPLSKPAIRVVPSQQPEPFASEGPRPELPPPPPHRARSRGDAAGSRNRGDVVARTRHRGPCGPSRPRLAQRCGRRGRLQGRRVATEPP